MKQAKRDVQIVPPEKYNFVSNSEVSARLNEQMQDELAEAPAHGIECIEYKVLIEPIKVDEKTKGGIILPDQTIETDQHASMEGTIRCLSPFAFSYEEWPQGARKPRVGDHVIFSRYSGINLKGNDGRDYRLMNDKDIVAVRRAKA